MERLPPSIYALLACVCLFTSGCTKPCTITRDKAPSIRGFKLGMLASDLKTRFSTFADVNQNQYGYALVVIDKAEKPDPIPAIHRIRSYAPERNVTETYLSGKTDSDLHGVERIYLHFVDRKLASIQAYYINEPRWNSVDEFVNRVSASLGINATWESAEDKRRLKCDDYLTLDVGIDRDYFNPRTEEKLPFIKAELFFDIFESTSRRLKAEQEQEKKAQQEKGTFRP